MGSNTNAPGTTYALGELIQTAVEADVLTKQRLVTMCFFPFISATTQPGNNATPPPQTMQLSNAEARNP